jgi:hypothetical protein
VELGTNIRLTSIVLLVHDITTKIFLFLIATIKGESIRVAGNPMGCETSRLPHCLDDLFTDGGEALSLTYRPLFTTQVDSWYKFLLEFESIPET